jgi:hypothetical protein
MKDGKPHQLISGSFHYSRCPAELWEDRLTRLHSMGLNSIQTYVPWNWHEEEEGDFNWSGDHNLTAFLVTAQKVGLDVLVRSGPYMCGEWEFGGLPAWLLSKDGLVLRTMNDPWIKYTDLYLTQLHAQLAPLLYSAGGPILMVQVENEFGSYGNVESNAGDKAYLQHLLDFANAAFGQKASEEKVIIYTTDGGNTGFMSRGSFKGASLFTTGDGDPSDGSGIFAAMKEWNAPGKSAGINSEDYSGWLTHYGEHMANKSSANFATQLTALLHNKGSINMYMGFGGTNFGFFSGANGGGQNVQYHITSYDYDSPLAEGAQHGYGSDGVDKYVAVRDAIAAYTGVQPPAEPASPRVTAFGAVAMTESAPMLSAASLAALAPKGPVGDGRPRSMEQYGQNYGFVMYSAETPSGIDTSGATVPLQVLDYIRDRAHVFLDGNDTGVVIYRNDKGNTAALPAGAVKAGGGQRLGLLVENMGRVNFGHGMTDPKGITTDVLLGGHNLSASAVAQPWSVHNIPLQYAQLKGLPFGAAADAAAAAAVDGPVFHRGSLSIGAAEAGSDTYFNTRQHTLDPADGSWTKGYVWVNGHLLGRYWETEGPQHALYCPSTFLREGANEIIVLELHPAAAAAAALVLMSTDVPDFKNAPPPSSCTAATVGHTIEVAKCDGSRNAQQLWDLDGAVPQISLHAVASAAADATLPGAAAAVSVSGSVLFGTGHGAAGAARPLAAGAAALCLSRGPGQDKQYHFPLAQLEPCGSTDADEANVLRADGSIYNAASKMCLDVSNHATADGSPVGWYSCTKAANQQFSLVESPLHGFQVVEKETGMCLTAC